MKSKSLILAVFLFLNGSTNCLSAEEQAVWTFIENGVIKLGIKESSGGAIGWFSLAGSDRNLVNHFDHGRLIQQSYYGKPDGSKWAKKEWVWNPVQGGDYLGSAAKVLEFDLSKHKLYVRTKPKHWATGEEINDVLMEQWIELQGTIAHIKYRMTYSGTEFHPRHDQEIPAVFTDRTLETLIIGQEQGVITLHPGFPNERYPIPKHWAAYLDSKHFGLGVCVPQADVLTCYRVGEIGEKGACSYLAPLAVFAIKPNLTFEYDCYLTIGSQREIQTRFQKIMDDPKAVMPARK